jgi:aspartate 1-decarboxylase
MRTILNSKLHRARVTQAELNYIGSCGIDQDILDAAGIAQYEQIDIWNVDNGERFTTYAISAPRGSKIFTVNGSAARRVQIGDVLIIATWKQMTDEEIANHEPSVVFFDDDNNMVTAEEAESLGTILKVVD